jgi:hypothetical protein
MTSRHSYDPLLITLRFVKEIEPNLMFIFLKTKLSLRLTTPKFNSTSHIHARYRGLNFEELKLVLWLQFQTIQSAKHEEQVGCDYLKHLALYSYIIRCTLTVQ